MRLFLSAVALVSAASAQSELRTGWHNGDPCDCGLTLMASHYRGSDDFSLVFDDFTVPQSGWTVTGIYADHLTKTQPGEAWWELRTRVGRNSAGLLIQSGRSPVSATRLRAENRDGDVLVRLEVSGLHVRLAPGRSWVALAPVGPDDSFAVPTQGDGGVGSRIESSLGAIVNMRHPEHEPWNWFPAILLRSLDGGKDAKSPEYSKGVRIAR